MKRILTLLLSLALLLGLTASASAQTMVLFTPWGNTSTDADTALVRKSLEEELAKDGLDIQLDWIITPTDGSLEKLNVLLSSGEQIDAVSMNIGDARGYLTTGNIIRPINDLLEQHGQNLKKMIPENAWAAVTDKDGNIWAIPDYYMWRWQGAAIRTDLLAEVGLEMPTTIAELENVMQVFKETYPDMIPAVGLPWFSDPFLQGAVSGVASQMTEWALSPEGKVVPSMSLPEYKNMIALYTKWVENGWLDPEWLSGSDDSQSKLWVSGRTGIYFCDPHRALDWTWAALKANFPEATGDFIPVLKAEDGKAHFPLDYGVGRIVWVPQMSKNPEAVVQFFDKMVSDLDFYFIAENGIPGEHWIDNGDSWSLPEGISTDNPLYADVFSPLSWEFIDVQKPSANANPDAAGLHDRLNESYAEAEIIYTGLEGFTLDGSQLGMYNPIDLYENLFNITIGVNSLDDFDAIIANWYATGGQELVDAYTQQYEEWKAAQ